MKTKKKPNRKRFRPVLEQLERRELLAICIWTGLAGDAGNWNNSANWTGGLIPGPADDVIIPGVDTPAQAPPTVNVNATVRSLSTGPLTETSNVLQVTIENGVTLTVEGGTSYWGDGSDFGVGQYNAIRDILNGGTLHIKEGTFNFADGWIDVGQLTVDGGIFNMTGTALRVGAYQLIPGASDPWQGKDVDVINDGRVDYRIGNWNVDTIEVYQSGFFRVLEQGSYINADAFRIGKDNTPGVLEISSPNVVEAMEDRLYTSRTNFYVGNYGVLNVMGNLHSGGILWYGSPPTETRGFISVDPLGTVYIFGGTTQPDFEVEIWIPIHNRGLFSVQSGYGVEIGWAPYGLTNFYNYSTGTIHLNNSRLAVVNAVQNLGGWIEVVSGVGKIAGSLVMHGGTINIGTGDPYSSLIVDASILFNTTYVNNVKIRVDGAGPANGVLASGTIDSTDRTLSVFYEVITLDGIPPIGAVHRIVYADTEYHGNTFFSWYPTSYAVTTVFSGETGGGLWLTYVGT